MTRRLRSRAGGPAGRPAGDPDDAELLRRHVHGDRDAFGLLVRRHRDRLWAVALRTLGDPEEAADALQDALLAAYRRADSFRGEAQVTTWLHRIVVNACLDRTRRRAARVTEPLPEEESAEDPPAGRQRRMALAVTEPDAAEARETRLDVLAALATLPVEQRAALVLVDMEGWSVAEAATMLGCAEGTVKSRCARGRARLLPLLAHLRPQARASEGNPPAADRVPSPGGTPDTTAGPRDVDHRPHHPEEGPDR